MSNVNEGAGVDEHNQALFNHTEMPSASIQLYVNTAFSIYQRIKSVVELGVKPFILQTK